MEQSLTSRDSSQNDNHDQHRAPAVIDKVTRQFSSTECNNEVKVIISIGVKSASSFNCLPTVKYRQPLAGSSRASCLNELYCRFIEWRCRGLSFFEQFGVLKNLARVNKQILISNQDFLLRQRPLSLE